jgi:glycosyltransferase involved in cell wall biosynthesis
MLSQRAMDADLFLAPSRYFAQRMTERLSLPPEKVRVVYNGINLEGYGRPTGTEFGAVRSGAPVLGFFARMCPEKGLDMLVDAYLLLRQRDRVKDLKLRVGGGCGPADVPFVEAQRAKLRAAGLLQDAEFCPNLSRDDKLDFLRSLTVMSTPALYGEAFGLYLIEALAAGIPVVQPRHAAFPELIEATGGGVVCEPSAKGLAATIEQLLSDPIILGGLSAAGRSAVFKEFSVERMAEGTARVFEELCGRND